MKNLVFLILLSLLNYSLSAQDIPAKGKKDKVVKLQEFYTFNKTDFINDSIDYNKIDTTFFPFFYYNPQLYNFKTNLGNNGTAQKDLKFQSDSKFGFNTQFDQLDDFRFNHQKNEYFQVSQPYAKAFYINGAQKEEGIEIEFSQNINPSWNIGLEYKKVSSEGFYLRQRASINSFRMFQSYKSKNNRYGVIANLNYNDSYNEENGGIVNDSLFTESNNVSRKGIPVRFDQARNISRNQEFYVKQFLNFGKVSTQYYTDDNDSIYLDSIIGKSVIPKLTPYHEFRYNNKEFGYVDLSADSLNYPAGSVNNGMNISDFTNLKEVDNMLGIRWMINRNKSEVLENLSLKAFGGFQYLEYFQQEFYTGKTLNNQYLTNTIIGASLSNDWRSKYHFSINYHEVTEGYDVGDRNINLTSSNQLGKMKVSAEIHLEKSNPKIVFRDFSSATYSWKNNLNLIERNGANLEIEIPNLRFKLGADYNAISNYTYFDHSSKVNQFNRDLSIFQAYLSQSFRVWKFHLNLNLRYQNIDKSDIINIPEFLSYSSFYFETTIFKKEMLVRAGSDLYYTTDYTGDSYNPTIRQYQTQNTNTIGSYPWLEAYMMVKVDRTYFFVRVTNLLEGAVPYNYFAAPSYPMPDRALKFGIKWEFIN